MAKTFHVAWARCLFSCVVLLAAVPAAHAQEPAFRWRELAPPARASHAIVWDSRRDRALMIGGEVTIESSADGVWELVREGQPRWRILPALGAGPRGRSGCSAVYDSLGDRVLVYGGRVDWARRGTSELWALSLSGTPEWSVLAPATSEGPPPRANASLILDSHDRLVLFGGDDAASCDSSIWLLSLAESPPTWRSVTLTGRGPGPRARHGAVYSAATHRMTVFGGDRACESPWGGYQQCAATTWDLRLTEPMRWIMRASAPLDSVPLPETGGTFVADPRRGIAWLVSGDQRLDIAESDVPSDGSVWQLDLHSGTWTRMHTSDDGPSPRAHAAACVVPSSGEVLLHGGSPHPFPNGLWKSGRGSAQTWRLEGEELGWSELVHAPGFSGSPTLNRRVHLDASTRTLVTWGREGVLTLDLEPDATWRLDPRGASHAPLERGAASVLDTRRRRLLVFGGADQDLRSLAPTQLAAWSLDDPGAWVTIPIEGSPPMGAWGHQSIYDATRDRVVVLPSSFFDWPLMTLDSVSVLELEPSPHWVRSAVQGDPPRERSFAGVVVDRKRDRLLLVGGVVHDFDRFYPRDLWTLSLEDPMTWVRRIDDSNGSVFMFEAGLVMDETLDRLLALGGNGASKGRSVFSSSLEELATWTNLDPGGVGPIWPDGGSGFFDAWGNRALFWSGSLWEITWSFGTPDRLGTASIHADQAGVHIRWPGPVAEPYAATVERSSDGGRSWNRVGTVRPQGDGSLALTDFEPSPTDLNIYRVIIERGGELRVIGTASLGSAAGPLSGVGLSGLSLAPPRPNPATGDVTIELATPVATQVTLELFDLSGRRVGASVHRDVAAGSVAFTLPLAHGLKPGIYMLRASDGRRTVRSRLAVIR